MTSTTNTKPTLGKRNLASREKEASPALFEWKRQDNCGNIWSQISICVEGGKQDEDVWKNGDRDCSGRVAHSDEHGMYADATASATGYMDSRRQ
jgi:hypothetical protein